MRALVAPLVVGLSLSLGFGATGCIAPEAKTSLGYTANAKRAYDEAMVEFDGHNWIEAQSAFREVKKKYGYSRYARLAELRIADADFAQEKYAEAIHGYRQFVHDHRSDAEDVAYARSRIAEAEFKQISDSILLPVGEERDQAVVMDAYKELRGFLSDYPDAKESKHIRALLADVTARLMRHELYVARFYLSRDNYDAAAARVLHALKNFTAQPLLPGVDDDTVADLKPQRPDETGLQPEALLLLGETYLRMHRWRDARTTFNTILRAFPGSGHVDPAGRYLDYMHARGI